MKRHSSESSGDVNLPALLICDDDPEFLSSLERALAQEFGCLLTTTAEALRGELAKQVSLVLLDIRLREDDANNRDGLKLLAEIQELRPELPVVMMTAYGEIELAVEAMRLGAVDFIDKNRASITEIRKALLKALEQSQLRRKVSSLERDVALLAEREFVGEHPSVQELRQVIRAVADDGRVTVLIQGETGTGKELVARAIHAQGWRHDQPFTPVALCAMAPDVVEVEMFGSVPGGFTDARARTGYLQDANGGVLFLDDVSATPPATQPKLLRFLEERTFQRVGSSEPMSVDVQVVATTNRDLRALCQAGEFREDLYFRLNGFVIEIPPLRDRVEDIPILAAHFLERLRAAGRSQAERFTQETVDLLMAHSWPGNVRELKNSVDNLMLRADPSAREIALESVPTAMWDGSDRLPGAGGLEDDLDTPLDERMARFELGCIEAALGRTGGRKAEAAEALGLNDRFAIRRRVMVLLRDFPRLADDFADLISAYNAAAPQSNEQSLE